MTRQDIELAIKVGGIILTLGIAWGVIYNKVENLETVQMAQGRKLDSILDRLPTASSVANGREKIPGAFPGAVSFP
jgi:hypothetical protein